MIPGNADHAPCGTTDQEKTKVEDVQKVLAPFLRPTILDKDKVWNDIEKMPYADKVALIRGDSDLVTTSNSPTIAVPPFGEAALRAVRVRAHAFGKMMLQQFLAYHSATEIDDAHLCAAINFIAFAKWSDLEALDCLPLRVNKDGEKLDDWDLYEYVCQEILTAALRTQRLDRVPRVFVLKGSKIEVRLSPYDKVLFIFLNEDPEEIDEKLLFAAITFALFHEVGHYLYWNGNACGASSFEFWTRGKISELDSPEQVETYLAFEEFFCDGVGVAAGKDFAARAVMTAIVHSSKTLQEHGFGRNRLISLLRTMRTLFPSDFPQFYGLTNDTLKEVGNHLIKEVEIDNASGQLFQMMDRYEVRNFLEDLRNEAVKMPALSILHNWWTTHNRVITKVLNSQGVDGRAKLRKEWAAQVRKVVPSNDMGSQTDKLFSDANATTKDIYPTPEDLLAKFKAQGDQSQLKKFNAQWFSVLQADGWGNRPTKNNIGT